MSEPSKHPACPLDEAACAWTLGEKHGTGLVSGLRALWRAATREAIDARGDATGVPALLVVEPDVRIAIALQPRDNSVLLRLRGFLEDARGVALLEALARAHANLVLQGERWTQANPDPAQESLTPLTLASVIDAPDALVRALKPGH